MIDPRFLMGQGVQINPNIPVEQQIQAGDVLGGVNQLMGQYQTGRALQGDTNALKNLMMTNPQAAMQIQESKAAQQASAAKAEQSRRANRMKVDQMVMSQLAKLNSPEDLALYNERMGDRLRDYYGDEYGDPDMSDVLLSKTLLGGGIPPKEVADMEGGLRKEFLAQAKDFKLQNSAYGRIVKSAEEPSAAGDLALIFNYMKILDPGSTVREGEFANAQNAGGVDARVMSLYNQVINGTRLTEDQRADFLNRATRLYQGALDENNQRGNYYRDLAGKYNLNPENVVPELQTFEIEEEQTAPGQVQTVVIRQHPVYGDITEEDILLTAKENNQTRQQVIRQLTEGM